MKTGTKFVVYGGVATAVLGPALVASVMVSVGNGAGTFAGITVRDGLPALTDGFQQYEGGSPGMFGEPGVDAPAAPPAPAG